MGYLWRRDAGAGYGPGVTNAAQAMAMAVAFYK
jgi:hypothetical protein